jgi:hypothetical protein
MKKIQAFPERSLRYADAYEGTAWCCWEDEPAATSINRETERNM